MESNNGVIETVCYYGRQYTKMCASGKTTFYRNGRPISVMELSRDFGVKYFSLVGRIKKGTPIDKLPLPPNDAWYCAKKSKGEKAVRAAAAARAYKRPLEGLNEASARWLRIPLLRAVDQHGGTQEEQLQEGLCLE